MMKYLSLLLIVVMSVTHAYGRTPDEVPNVHVARADAHVSNPDGVLSAAAVALVDSIVEDIWRSTSAEVSVVVVEDMSGQDVDSYATELFEMWKIGKKDRDNGLLVVVSRDDRKAAIRTGYGMEGVVTDVRAGQLIRDVMTPHFREGDYDGGIIETAAAIAGLLKDPDATEELMSKYANNADAHGADDDNFFTVYLVASILAVTFMLVMLFYNLFVNRKLDGYERYMKLEKLRLPGLMVTCVTLGMGIVMWLPLVLIMRHIRLKKRSCPNCGHKMFRVDEVHDNDFLTPAQDTEEKLNSVDYDVWLCPQCNETDILPYVNNSKTYSVCPDCGARACSLQSDRIIQQPTTTREGQGIKRYVCHNCHHTNDKYYRIAKLAPVIVGGVGGGGRGFGGGGGFSGGSFGGGLTGGGGASGGW